jgi:hypothetical protein
MEVVSLPGKVERSDWSDGISATAYPAGAWPSKRSAGNRLNARVREWPTNQFAATRRVLLSERRHMNLVPKQILDEIESLRPSFPALNKVDEIWVVETIFYGPISEESIFGSSCLRGTH